MEWLFKGVASASFTGFRLFKGAILGLSEKFFCVFAGSRSHKRRDGEFI